MAADKDKGVWPFPQKSVEAKPIMEPQVNKIFSKHPDVRLELPNGWYLIVTPSDMMESPCTLFDANDTELMSGAMMEPEEFAEAMWNKDGTCNAAPPT